MKIIRFTALWCADCIVMRPRWDSAFASKNLQIEDFDLDDNPDEAEKYNVSKVPQLIIMDDGGQEVERLSGMKDPEDLEAIIKKYFND